MSVYSVSSLFTPIHHENFVAGTLTADERTGRMFNAQNTLEGSDMQSRIIEEEYSRGEDGILKNMKSFPTPHMGKTSLRDKV